MCPPLSFIHPYNCYSIQLFSKMFNNIFTVKLHSIWIETKKGKDRLAGIYQTAYKYTCSETLLDGYARERGNDLMLDFGISQFHSYYIWKFAHKWDTKFFFFYFSWYNWRKSNEMWMFPLLLPKININTPSNLIQYYCFIQNWKRENVRHYYIPKWLF